MSSLSKFIKVSPVVAEALEAGRPVVALESTVITHGLPYPENLGLAQDMERVIRDAGAIPATIAALEGTIRVGLEEAELAKLAEAQQPRKLSARDLGAAAVQGASGGTTVAGTLAIAAQVGIRVFATGGIGGVHRGAPFDVSADLGQLGRSPVVVVCAGAKAILDLPATLEVLETMGVTVVGFQTDELPAFYSRSSGLPVSLRADTAEEIAAMALAQWGLGLARAVLVGNPPPEDSAMPVAVVEEHIATALAEAEAAGVRGPAVTPFLLKRMTELSGGDSLQANLALLKNNARLAAEIAKAMEAEGH